MQLQTFHRFRELARRQAGLEFSDAKLTLISARVAKRLRALGLQTEEEYIDLLERDSDVDELVQFLDAVTTNYTNFLRESDHFELLAQKLREWAEDGQRRFRIWCAAAASGEEPYTLAITAREALEVPRSGIDVKILATDISTRALARATAGVYAEDRVAPLPPPLRQRYFTRKGPQYTVRDELKASVVFRRLNLARPPFPMSGPLDAIFCRNVMMYLGTAVKQGLVDEFERLVRPDGLVVVGHAESLTGLDTPLAAIRPSAYTLRASARGGGQ